MIGRLGYCHACVTVIIIVTQILALGLEFHCSYPLCIRQQPLETLLNELQQLFEDELRTVQPYTRRHCRFSQTLRPGFSSIALFPLPSEKPWGRSWIDWRSRESSHSDWVAPIVPVPKKDGRFRICGDYKVTVNQVLLVEQCPLPKPEDLSATLAGDLSQTFLQVQLDEQSKSYTTVNMHPPGLVPVYKTPFWCGFSPCILPKDDGRGPAGDPRLYLLY